MKHLLQRRLLPVFLCMMLALGLTACGGKDAQPVETETGSTAGTLSGSKGEKDNRVETPSGSGEVTAEVDPKLAEESLNLLYDAMAFDDQYAGAVAYLGYKEQGDAAPLSDWLWENCAGLVEAMPFLLDIPAEHIRPGLWRFILHRSPGRNDHADRGACHMGAFQFRSGGGHRGGALPDNKCSACAALQKPG